jgi:hypothetical protein
MLLYNLIISTLALPNNQGQTVLRIKEESRVEKFKTFRAYVNAEIVKLGSFCTDNDEKFKK